MTDNIIVLKCKMVNIGDNMSCGLKKERMQEIERTVEHIIKDLDFSSSVSVDIVSLVKRDHFQVETQSMPIETTGILLVNDNPQTALRRIIVNRQFTNPDNEEDVIFKKSRFITAHEYGHFILHKSLDKPLYAHRDTDKRDEAIELEADYFARSVLMPLPYFQECFRVLSEMSKQDYAFICDILSGLFKVTHKKVKARIDDLHVLAS